MTQNKDPQKRTCANVWTMKVPKLVIKFPTSAWKSDREPKFYLVDQLNSLRQKRTTWHDYPVGKGLFWTGHFSSDVICSLPCSVHDKQTAEKSSFLSSSCDVQTTNWLSRGRGRQHSTLRPNPAISIAQIWETGSRVVILPKQGRNSSFLNTFLHGSFLSYLQFLANEQKHVLLVQPFRNKSGMKPLFSSLYELHFVRKCLPYSLHWSSGECLSNECMRLHVNWPLAGSWSHHGGTHQYWTHPTMYPRKEQPVILIKILLKEPIDPPGFAMDIQHTWSRWNNKPHYVAGLLSLSAPLQMCHVLVQVTSRTQAHFHHPFMAIYCQKRTGKKMKASISHMWAT